MAKFYGKVGYAEQIVIRPWVHEDRLIERTYFGDVEKDAAKWRARSDSVNQDLTVSNVINIIADAYAQDHIFAMRYVEWAGVKWQITDVEVIRPRLKLRLGGVYNGPIPT